MDKENQVDRTLHYLFDILKTDFYGNVFGEKQLVIVSVTKVRMPQVASVFS